jgi:crotonobetainyl-CoA:carnitine CoA-transferase CaiB-like acyl-CoA transferase
MPISEFRHGDFEKTSLPKSKKEMEINMERWKKIERVPAPALIPNYGPLSGMRVLMTGSIVAAPFAASILAEYGAEVIHVERPKIGDPYRLQSPVITNGNGDGRAFRIADSNVPPDQKVSTGWIQDGRNKLCMGLEVNLKIPEAKEIFLSLIKNCDVWMENMVWTEKLGITDDMLLEVNPKLVIAHISGFGRPQFGGVPEECDRPSYDPIGQAEGGYMYINGFPEPMPPSHATSFVNDYLTAVFSVTGILMAFRHAEKTGEGQVVDVAQIESMSKCLNDTFVNYFTLGMVKERNGNKVPIFQPGNLFKTKDNYLYIGTFGPYVYGRALKAMDIDIEKYPYEKAGASKEAINSELGKELNAVIEKWMMSHTSEEGMAKLRKHKVPCGIPRSAADLASSEHYQKRGNFIEYVDETLGKTVKAFGFGPKMSKTKPQVWRGSPRRGQDTDSILSKLAGYSESEIAVFKEKGIVE